MEEYRTPDELIESLNWTLDQCAEQYGVDFSKAYSLKTRLRLLVTKLAQINSVVILVDEYDKPILDHLYDPEKAEAQREVLKNFYSTFKGLDEYLRCIFITGESKFSKASIFSGLNNLSEISYTAEGADLLGYTQKELEHYFGDYIKKLSSEQQESIDACKEKIKYWYHGYQFCDEPIKAYNPFSIAHLFNSGKFKNYWFESGTPTFLVEYIKQHPRNLRNIKNSVFGISTLGTLTIDQLPLETLFFQSGYLTIKSYDKEYDVYTLDYPNAEIRQSLSLLELGILADIKPSAIDTFVYDLRQSLVHNNLELFAKNLQVILASIPSYLHIEKEAYYHSLMQLLCIILGFETSCEVATSKGRINLVLNAEKYIYVIELKFDKSSSVALEQIKSRKYYEKYLST